MREPATATLRLQFETASNVGALGYIDRRDRVGPIQDEALLRVRSDEACQNRRDGSAPPPNRSAQEQGSRDL